MSSLSAKLTTSPETMPAGPRVFNNVDPSINWDDLIKNSQFNDVALVSIVICVYGRMDLTEQCLNSLYANDERISFEIIVVNNGSDPDTKERLDWWAFQHNNLSVIHNTKNLNFALGCNVGFSFSRGAYVVFLNNDTQVCPGWLDALIAPLDDPFIKGAQPKLLYPDGTIQGAGLVFQQHSPLAYPIYANKDGDYPPANKSRTFKAITAACIAIRAQDFATARGFDTEFINGQEDVDLCLRLGQGAACYQYVPQSVVIHHEGKTVGRGNNVERNRKIFLARWGETALADDTKYYSEDRIVASNYEPDVQKWVEKGYANWLPKSLDAPVPDKILAAMRRVFSNDSTELDPVIAQLLNEISDLNTLLLKEKKQASNNEKKPNSAVEAVSLPSTDKRIEELRQANLALLQSTSWRITKPLRDSHALAARLVRLCKKIGYWASTPELTRARIRIVINKLRNRLAKTTTPGGGIIPEASAVSVVKAQFSSYKNRPIQPNVSTAIIIPIYNAADELRTCIDSVIRHTHRSLNLILINDCSPDPAVTEVLSLYQDTQGITIIHNETNLGFTRTVNRGIEEAGSADVVLLNSDTIVTPHWLRNLKLAAYSEDKIATATPFSNNAGAFSAPVVGKENFIPSSMSLDDCARLISNLSERAYPKVPTGHGFCMYVRRDCLNQIGALDFEAFPRGYGEENDLCMRAGRAGWKHVVDDATLVYHVRSASFGTEKNQLMINGRAKLDERYPEYDQAIRVFHGSALKRARARVQDAFNTPNELLPVRPRVLFVISTVSGGTPQTNKDLMSALSDRYEPFLLRCDSRVIELSQITGEGVVSLEKIPLKNRMRPFPHTSDEYDEIVRNLLIQKNIEMVHIRHIGWHGLGLTSVCQSLSIPTVFSFHDFYTICPNVKLLDENLKHCGGVCTATPGQCHAELWDQDTIPPLKNEAIFEWQNSMNRMLAMCDAYITTSKGARDQIANIYPETMQKPFYVIPHGRDLQFHDLAQWPTSGDPKVRILVPGNIVPSKGSYLIEAVRDLDVENLFEFHILGYTTIPRGRNIVRHGRYLREDFMEKVSRIKPHLGAIFSIWPETFCHTLTEMWSCGIPVVALDFGAVGERLKDSGAGWTFDRQDPAYVYRRLLEIVDNRNAYADKHDAVINWQNDTGRTNTTKAMATPYDQVYRAAMTGSRLTNEIFKL
ncbi:glycosyltransferase [Phyllobacterium sp. K27]